METDLPFDLVFNQAICLDLIPEVTCSVFRVIGQGMQKNLVELLMTTMPHDGGLPCAFMEGKLEGSQQIDEQSEHWGSRILI